MTADLRPFDLSWAEVDPARHRFDAASAPGVVAGLRPARSVPSKPPAGPPGDRTLYRWSDSVGQAWADEVTRALVDRYGRWAVGWRWARGEGDMGGGPVGSWCCPHHSIGTREETLGKVAAGLCEWRAWLEELSAVFDRYPVGTAVLSGLAAEDRLVLWAQAADDLVTRVVERTGAGDVWYAHGEQVLTWFLVRCGLPRSRAARLVAEAAEGRFRSWSTPTTGVVTEVAERLAFALESPGR